MSARNPFWTDDLAATQRSLESWRFPDGTLNLTRNASGTISATIGGELTTLESNDFIVVNLVAGQEYLFLSTSSWWTTSVSIYDQQGYLLQFTDGSEIGLRESTRSDTIVNFVPSYTGAHMLSVRWEFVPGAQGFYAIGASVTRGNLIAGETPPPATISGSNGNDILNGTTAAEQIVGGRGSDLITGIGGNDTIDGGSGVDVARFSGNASASQITRSGDQVTVTGADGVDTLTGVDVLLFADGATLARAPQARGLFDEAYYLAENPDVAAAVRSGQFGSGQAHFQAYGRVEGRSPNAFFDPAYYLAKSPDVAAAIRNWQFDSAFQHFELFGLREDRDPSPVFDVSAYRTQNSLAANADALGHFLSTGFAAGRLAPVADLGYWG